MIKFINEITTNSFESKISYIFNLQTKVDQPVYLITRILDNKFTDIECFTTDGEIDLEELKRVYNERYNQNEKEKYYEVIEINLRDIYNPFE